MYLNVKWKRKDFENDKSTETIYLTKTPFNTFSNRADPDQSGSTLLAYGNVISYNLILVDLINILFCSMYKRERIFTVKPV